MPVRDPFSYSARWDSVGLDCSCCVHFRGPGKWPDEQRVSHCAFHKRSLEIELGSNGYKNGEWFCREFKDMNGRSQSAAQGEFNRVQAQLDPAKLYGAYGKQGYLKEYDFAGFKAVE